MKILMPIEFYRKGGVERVIISLIPELLNYVDLIIIVTSPEQTHYFRSLLPSSDKLVYENFALNPDTLESKIYNALGIIQKFISKFNNKQLSLFIFSIIERYKIGMRLNQLAEYYQADHCLYPLINRLRPPKVNLPLSGIVYDIFWHFSPLTYSPEFIATYDIPLRIWLEKAQVIFTISQKTKDDILKIFPAPEFERKLKPVLLAGLPARDTLSSEKYQDKVIFYFPSSFGIYKDHLTVIKAVIKLAGKNLDFKVIFIGKETDSLVNGQLKLTQQSFTQEYQEYLRECNEMYETYKDIMSTYIEGLGYRDYEEVEDGYKTCSCVLMPSKYEGFGLAVSEALMWGIPVIASELEVYKEQVRLYISEDRVQFYKPGDVEELVICMEQFITHPVPRLSPAEVARKMELWTWNDVARKYLSLLEEADKNAG